MLGAEQRLGPLDSERFDTVHVFGAAVVTLAGVALGVLVVQERAQCLQDRGTGDVLGRNQLEGVLLPLEFVTDRGGDFRIDGIDPAGQVGAGLQHPAHYPRSGLGSRSDCARSPSSRLRCDVSSDLGIGYLAVRGHFHEIPMSRSSAVAMSSFVAAGFGAGWLTLGIFGFALGQVLGNGNAGSLIGGLVGIMCWIVTTIA